MIGNKIILIGKKLVIKISIFKINCKTLFGSTTKIYVIYILKQNNIAFFQNVVRPTLALIELLEVLIPNLEVILGKWP